MKRRQFLALSALALATSPTWAESSNKIDFTPEAYEAALESGEPFLLDFSANW